MQNGPSKHRTVYFHRGLAGTVSVGCRVVG